MLARELNPIWRRWILHQHTSPADPDHALNPQPTHRFRRATLAASFSVLFPGLGQIYNRQPRKGLAIAVSFPILALIMGETRALLSFWALVAILPLLIGWRLFIAADAARFGWTGRKHEARFQRPAFIIPIFVVLVVLCNVLPTSSQFLNRCSYFRAFKVPRGSMCPTMCPGERIVADMVAYRSRTPQRGELILLKLPVTHALLTKRVIGVAGDVVEAGPMNEVIVNGKRLNSPEICGKPVVAQNSLDQLPYFPSITVPLALSLLSAIISATATTVAIPSLAW